MGYASYTTWRDGAEIEAGYAVDATCDQAGCPAEIDRGLGYLCGKTPGGDEHGCGYYFCGEHLYYGPQSQCCGECLDRQCAEDGDPMVDPDHAAREHTRRCPDHEVVVGSDDEWRCLTCEQDEEHDALWSLGG